MSRRTKKAKKGINRKLLYGIVLVTLVILAVVVAYYLFFQPNIENWTAAIIDQVTVEGENFFNQDFNTTIVSLLNSSGFDVKYYPGDDVTVDFYKDLPLKGRKIILLRAHSSVRTNSSDFVDLFTSEPYSESGETKYSSYGDQISVAEFLSTGNKYFAIGPTFVDFSMKGRFDDDCVIILMGCSSLEEESMAKALVDKDAKVVIGWTRGVELDDTDKSTLDLLKYLLAESPYTIKGAVDKINDENPHNPYGAELDYYPKSAWNYIVPTRKNETSLYLMKVSFQVLLLANLVKWKLDSIAFF
jgi:hypothetical protein